MDGVVILVARKLVLTDKHITNIVTILRSQIVEINDFEIHSKQENVTLTDVMVVIWHLIFRYVN